jgi:hypothetical protein
MGHEAAQRVVERAHVEVEHSIVLTGLGLVEATHGEAADGVDEPVELPPGLDGGAHHPVGASRSGQIHGERQAAHLVGGGLRQLQGAIGDCQARARGGEHPQDRARDRAAAAGDEIDPVLECLHATSLRHWRRWCSIDGTQAPRPGVRRS